MRRERAKNTSLQNVMFSVCAKIGVCEYFSTKKNVEDLSLYMFLGLSTPSQDLALCARI